MKKVVVKIIIAEVILVALLLILSITHVSFKKTLEEPETTYYSEYDSRITMGSGVNTQDLPLETGAIPEEFYTPEEKEFGKLVDSLPIRTEQFELQMDFTNNKIVVNLSSPYESSQKAFLSWLQENGYEDIAQTNFFINDR